MGVGSGGIDHGENSGTRKHSSLRGQRREKGYILRKWLNEREHVTRPCSTPLTHHRDDVSENSLVVLLRLVADVHSNPAGVRLIANGKLSGIMAH